MPECSLIYLNFTFGDVLQIWLKSVRFCAYVNSNLNVDLLSQLVHCWIGFGVSYTGCSIPLTVWMLIWDFFFLETEYRGTSHHILITVLTALVWPTFSVLVLDPFSWARNSRSRMEDSSCRLYQEVEPNSSIIFQLPWINSVDCYWLGRNYCNMRFDFQRPI